MALFALDAEPLFPPAHLAEPDGLLAIGGDLSPTRLLSAYRKGIFPWYNEPPILWWSPDPRFVLFPAELIISSSMKKMLRKNIFSFTVNQDFAQVIHHCKTTARHGQDGTWITDEMESAYINLHEMGYAISAETWQGKKLVGGVYGIKMGDVFFGESMFSHASNASKFALINLLQTLQKDGLQVMDCQVYTVHLESLGARMISRMQFTRLLSAHLPTPG